MNSDIFRWSILGIIVVSILTVALCAACPPYNVYVARMQGAAQLAQAQQNRQIAVQEAQAKLESAKLLAQAEIERAKGVDGANHIIAGGLKGNDEYLRYLWITDVAGKDVAKEVIYIPTEANIPIMERRK